MPRCLTLQHRPRPLDLAPLDLDAVPFTGNALDWSADGGLAAATADSVHIFSPQFMSASGSRMPIYDLPATQSGSGPDDDTEGQSGSQFATETGTRKQFGGSGQRIPVGYPRLDHTINQPLYQEWALDHPNGDKGIWQADPPKISAGSGPISGSGSTMNSVVSIAWSPSGVGRNQRCVLGVLTSSGMLIIYGEPLDGGEEDNETPTGRGQRVPRGRNSYDTSRWEVLWAVGERTAVPNQKRPGECITSFSWTGACDAIADEGMSLPSGPRRSETKALLVYQTDKGDIAVLDVGHSHYNDGRETWNVSEMIRIQAILGTHLTPAGLPVATSPDFVPHSTSFGLRCSPWMVEKIPMGPDRQPETLLTCVVGYITMHYVGFRRLTVMLRPNVAGGEQTCCFDTCDTAGFCIFMGANATLQFEEGLWSVDDGMESGISKKRTMCRAMISTPMVVKAFELEFAACNPNLPAEPSNVPAGHAVGTAGICSAVEPNMTEWHTNPISGKLS